MFFITIGVLANIILKYDVNEPNRPQIIEGNSSSFHLNVDNV